MTETPIRLKAIFSTFTVFLLLSIGCRGEQSNALELPPIGPKPGSALGTLRIHNVGSKPILQLVVAFPKDTVRYGDIGAGETTEYKDFTHGVYGNAAFGWVWKGRTISPGITDWHGDGPSPGDFTYQVKVEPYLHAEYVRLIGTARDK
jgi:hypothetical protein